MKTIIQDKWVALTNCSAHEMILTHKGCVLLENVNQSEICLFASSSNALSRIKTLYEDITLFNIVKVKMKIDILGEENI